MPLPPRTSEQKSYPRDPKAILVCDICGEAVSPTNKALISWNTDAMNNVSSFRLTHQKPCDNHLQQAKSGMLDHVSGLGWAYVTDVVSLYKWPGDALTRLVLIVWALNAMTNPDWKPDY